MSPLWGPACTVAIPEICPRSLILLAAMMKRLESAGISVLRSVVTSCCQMKPWDQSCWSLKIKVASHHLALVVDAGGKCGSISRQKAQVCDSAVCCQRAAKRWPSAAIKTDDLAAVINGVCGTGTLNQLKRVGIVVFPHYGASCRAGSRVAYGLASIVDPEC